MCMKKELNPTSQTKMVPESKYFPRHLGMAERIWLIYGTNIRYGIILVYINCIQFGTWLRQCWELKTAQSFALRRSVSFFLGQQINSPICKKLGQLDRIPYFIFTAKLLSSTRSEALVRCGQPLCIQLVDESAMNISYQPCNTTYPCS